jgi:coenzyme F420-reducing hydrogenase delta subunit
MNTPEKSTKNPHGAGERFACEVVVFHCNGGRLVCPQPSAVQTFSLDQTSIKKVYLPCTGRVDLATVLDCLEGGANGVLLIGCLSQACRFAHENRPCLAEQTGAQAARVAELLGFESGRVLFARAAGGPDLDRVIRSEAAKIKALGRSPLRHGRPAGERDES